MDLRVARGTQGIIDEVLVESGRKRGATGTGDGTGGRRGGLRWEEELGDPDESADRREAGGRKARPYGAGGRRGNLGTWLRGGDEPGQEVLVPHVGRDLPASVLSALDAKYEIAVHHFPAREADQN